MIKKLFSVSLLLSLSIQAAGAVTLTQTQGEDGQTLYGIEHARYRLAFVSDPGGWCVDFHFPKDGPDWVPSGAAYTDGGNLFVHMLSGDGWGASKHARAPRRIEIVEQAPDRVVLRFSTDLSGVPNIVHTITFADDTSAIRVDVSVKNDGAAAVLVGLWPHHHFAVDGKMLWGTFYRPGPHGVVPIGFEPPADGSDVEAQDLVRQARAADNDFLRRPTAGWTAAMNRFSRRGMVFLMDYNYLNTLYNCVPYSTTEWFYDKSPIPGGESWTTTYWAIPVEGLASVAHASERLICALAVEREGEQGVLAGRLLRGVAAPRKLEIDLAYRPLFGEPGLTSLPAPDIEALGDQATAFQVALPSAPPGKSLVFELTFKGVDADGKPFAESVRWLAAEEDAVSFDLLAGKDIHHFTREQPPKQKVFAKPKHMRLTTVVGCPMLELRGPGFYRTGVTTAATLADVFEIRGSYMHQSFDGLSVDYFPAAYDELFEYNLLVLNNVPVGVLQPYAQEMVKDFVEAGGSLLIFGGPDSLSAGRYHEGPVSTLLPVRLSGEPFQWKRLPEGDARRIGKAPDARILADVDVPAGWECEWAEAVDVADGAWAELMVGDRPFLVCGEVKGRYYTGRVAVVAGSVFGTSPNGFWNQPEWPRILGRIMDWINHGAHVNEKDFVPEQVEQ